MDSSNSRLSKHRPSKPRVARSSRAGRASKSRVLEPLPKGWLTLEAAAAHARTSVRSILARIYRGPLRGFLLDGEMVVDAAGLRGCR